MWWGTTPYSVHKGGVWNFLLIGQNRSSYQRPGMILEVQIQNFGANASKFSFSKNSRGLKYYYFFVKIGMKLPFTIMNKHKIQIWYLSLKTILFVPPEKNCFFMFWLWFSFKINKHTSVILFSILENAPKKSY